MKNKIFTGFATLIFGALLFSSCSKFPQTELDLAKAVVEETKAAGADVYQHESFVMLKDSLNAVVVLIEEQNSKFFKNFKVAKEGLEGVKSLAQDVKVKTEARIEELKAEVQATIASVNVLIENNKKLITEAPKGKEGTTALIAIKEEISAIEMVVVEANNLNDEANYMAALDKANVAKEKATSINVELTSVIEKYKAKGKR